MHVTDHSLAGAPPAPRAAAAGAGGAGPGYARKDHSLASITDRIVGEFDASNRDAVGGGRAAVVKNPDGSVQRHSGSTAPWHGNVPVDALAERLGVKRRRLYDVMNVLEAVGVTERISKGACKWHGATRVEACLEKLRAEEMTERASGDNDLSGDASSLKSLAARLMRHVGASNGAPVAFDACASALKLGGVPAPDAPGALGTGALAGAARRLHDVASILIRVGVLAFVEHEGKTKGRGDLKWLGAGSVTARLADGAAGAVVEKGYGAGAAAAARDGVQTRAPAPSMYYGAFGAGGDLGMVKTGHDGFGKPFLPADPAAAAKQASRLSSFFQRAPAMAPADAGGRPGARRPSVSFGAEALDARASIFSPPPGAHRPRDAADAAAAAAALMRSPEWIAQLSMAAAGGAGALAPSPAANGGVSALNPSWASPATVAPLQALYAWYSGNAQNVGVKTNGEGAARRQSAGSELDDARHTSGLNAGPAVSGLSGLSSLFDGNSPAEVEAAMHREAMHAAAAAAVQAAMGGVTARETRADPALAQKRRDAGRRGDAAESAFRR
jgi:hypothetical protein